MAETINFNIAVHVNGSDVSAAVGQITGRLVDMGRRGQAAVGGIQDSMKRLNFNALAQQISMVSQGFTDLAKPGLDLSTSMYDLQSMTGVAGKKLQEIEGYARQNAKTFGGSAAESMESYKLILSQLEPAIAGSPAALKAMGESVSILSKSMAGDAVSATEVLTTAMNQYQISTKDPIAASKEMARMMNVMQAAALAGSAELPDIKGALTESGMAAHMAGVSFEETNAAIEVLAKSGKKGAEGGVAIRNMLAIMGEGRFIPKHTLAALQAAHINVNALGDKSKTFSERLQMLKPLLNDSALLSRMFGKENMNAAMALISQTSLLEDYKKQVTGTTAAVDSAAIIMESPAEKAKRLQSSVDDLKISLFNGTNGWLGYAAVLGSTTRDFTNLWPAIALGGKVLGTITSSSKMFELGMKAGSAVMKIWTGVQTVFNAVMAAMPVIAIVLGVIALIAAIGYVIYAFDGWGAAWKHLMGFLGATWAGFKESFKFIWLNIQDGFLSGIELIEKAWYHLKSLWDEDGAKAGLAAINAQQYDRGAAIAESYGKIQEYNKQAAAEASQIFGKNGLHGNGKGVSDFASAIKQKLGLGGGAGIADAGIPGATDSKAGGTGNKGAVGGVGTKTNQAIATGGTKNTTVYVTIGKQVERLEIHSANLHEGVDKMQQAIVDGLTRAIVMGSSLGGAATS